MSNSSKTKKPQPTSLPWYKYPWVWFMISLPASAVVAGLYTLYVAQQNAPQVIVKQNKFQIEKD